MLQLQSLFLTQEFLMLKEQTTIQVPLQWIQMPLFGNELQFMMVKSTVRNNIKRMQMTCKPMVKNKRMQLILDFRMHQQHKFQHLLVLLKMQMDFLMLMQKETITQEQHQWTQMLKYGKEKKFMMVKYMEKRSICKMLMIFKLMVKSKRMLQIQDLHINHMLKE